MDDTRRCLGSGRCCFGCSGNGSGRQLQEQTGDRQPAQNDDDRPAQQRRERRHDDWCCDEDDDGDQMKLEKHALRNDVGWLAERRRQPTGNANDSTRLITAADRLDRSIGGKFSLVDKMLTNR